MSYPDIPPKLSETIPGSLLLHEAERKKQKKGKWRIIVPILLFLALLAFFLVKAFFLSY